MGGTFLVEKITFFMTIVIYMLQKIGSLSYLQKKSNFFVDFVQFVENCDILIMGIGIIGN